MTTERVPCPCCIRGQIANPELYPDDILGTSRLEFTRTVMDSITRGGFSTETRNTQQSRLVVCPTCKGSQLVGVDVAAGVLLTEA